MELRGEHVVALDRGAERRAVVARGDGVGRIVGSERVHEVHPRRVVEAVALALKYPNVYLDTAALYFDNPPDFLRFAMTVQVPLSVFERSLRRQLLFGSNYPRVEIKNMGIFGGKIVTGGTYAKFGANIEAVSREIQPLSVYLGVLGMPGMTAWVGLNLVEVKAGDVIYISGAAGAVGNVAGQLAKLRGCRVIGATGSMEKVMFLREECGFDSAFNYKAGSILDQLKLEAPDGIDVYFDNIGGETLEAALAALRLHGRIIACGGISGYNDEKPRPGPSNLFNITTKRLTVKGLMVFDWLDRQAEFEKEVGGYFKAGKVKHKETVVRGIDQSVGAFLGLFAGNNVGKMVVKLS